jgi:WD repeat and SOF domain-containing protein 1
VLYSQDARFVISGSDDSNIRLWKAEASKSLALMQPQARDKVEYRDKLKKKYGHMPAIRRIAKHRHVPIFIHNAKSKKQTMLKAARGKQKRLILHRKPGAIVEGNSKKKVVSGVIE